MPIIYCSHSEVGSCSSPVFTLLKNRQKSLTKNSTAVIKKWNKAVCEKQMGHFSYRRFHSQGRQVIQGLINTTSSYCLPFKICAKKLDLKSLNFLKLDSL